VPSTQEPETPEETGKSLPTLTPPPPPPARLVDLWQIVIVGNVLWLGVLAVALFTGPSVLAWTAFTGIVLGGIGMAIMMWQRSAARRGSKTAQQGL
jgi:protein-S-isoprenylcysteine O-methyltransferase Ste14